jgi:hypothetical protein
LQVKDHPHLTSPFEEEGRIKRERQGEREGRRKKKE